MFKNSNDMLLFAFVSFGWRWTSRSKSK